MFRALSFLVALSFKFFKADQIRLILDQNHPLTPFIGLLVGSFDELMVSLDYFFDTLLFLMALNLAICGGVGLLKKARPLFVDQISHNPYLVRIKFALDIITVGALFLIMLYLWGYLLTETSVIIKVGPFQLVDLDLFWNNCYRVNMNNIDLFQFNRLGFPIYSVHDHSGLTFEELDFVVKYVISNENREDALDDLEEDLLVLVLGFALFKVLAVILF